MTVLLEAWIASLKTLLPQIPSWSNRERSGLFGAALKRYIIGLFALLKTQWWLIGFEATMFYHLRGLEFDWHLMDGKYAPEHLLLSLLHILALFISLSFTLAIRKQRLFNWAHLRGVFLRCIQLSLYQIAAAILFVNLLLSLGIRRFPQMNIASLHAIEIGSALMLFYWLDSTFSFKDFFVCFERVCNFILYNLPVIAILYALFFGFDTALAYGIFGTGEQGIAGVILAHNPLSLFEGKTTIGQLALVKYLRPLYSHFIIACLYVLYVRRRREFYAEPIFFSRKQLLKEDKA